MELKDKPFEGCKEASLPGMYPLYYKPEICKSLFEVFENEPSREDLLYRYFVSDGEEFYGYNCGLTALNDIGGTTQVPAVVELKTNKIEKDAVYVLGGVRYKVYKAKRKINKDNYMYIKVLDVIEECYDYFEEDIIESIKFIIGRKNLDDKKLLELATDYSERTKRVIEDVLT